MPWTNSVESIQDAVAAILGAPAPVLAVDTCGVLDVVRSSYRFKSPVRLVEAAFGALGASITSPPALHILWFVEMDKELRRNLGSEHANLQKEMQKLSATGSATLSTTAANSWRQSVNEIESTLIRYTDAWVGASHRISVDPHCLLRAQARLAAGVRPGKRGSNNLGDCVITEHLLEVASRLRVKGFRQQVLFVSSNTKDYGELALKAPMDVQFATLGIDFHLDIEAAMTQIGF